jgi:hypothetical protein
MIGSWASWLLLLFIIFPSCEKGRRRQTLVEPLFQGKFDVRSFYRVLARNDVWSFPSKSIWRTKAPVKVTFFAWSAALGKIFTMDNLRKRHVIMIDRCCMCKRHGNLWIIFFFIVRPPTPYGITSSVALGYLGLCIFELLICSLAGGQWALSECCCVKMVHSCLMWCLWKGT